MDDKRTLVADPSPSKSGGKGRRKSAFAEEDEGYQYVEEGFRIRFANGETIDFYADNRDVKDDWMVALSQVIGKADMAQKAATWTDLVLSRERAAVDGSSMSSPAKAGVDVRDFTKPQPSPVRQNSFARKPVASKSAPNSPMKGQQQRSGVTSQPKAEPAPRPKTPPLQPRLGHRSRNAVKSMIF